jgi:hypothetical protein
MTSLLETPICRGDGEEWGRSDGSKKSSRALDRFSYRRCGSAGATGRSGEGVMDRSKVPVQGRRGVNEREATVEMIGYGVERDYKRYARWLCAMPFFRDDVTSL